MRVKAQYLGSFMKVQKSKYIVTNRQRNRRNRVQDDTNNHTSGSDMIQIIQCLEQSMKIGTNTKVKSSLLKLIMQLSIKITDL